LLHWPNGVTDLSGVVAAFENLRAKGKIRAWGGLEFQCHRHGKASKCSAWR
jgi:diketogulonate reductase-like aldo/keto reductase